MDANQTLLTIDLSAVAENYRRLQAMTKDVPVAGVVKANAYGLGVEQVGQTLLEAGAREFFVANIAEGVTLREAIGPEAIVFVIGGVLSGDAALLHEHALVPVLNSLHDVVLWKQTGNNAPCALHFDTGMNRLGLCAQETEQVLQTPDMLSGLNIILGMSHFASSEDLKDPLNALQIKRFRNITAHLTLPRWSLCNTSAIFLFGDDHYDLVRGGYGLYGGNPLPHTNNPMMPVVSLQARILQIKHVKRGEGIGYNAAYICQNDDEIAVAALGYADGYLRSQSSRGSVYWQGQPCPIAGRISMDLTTFRIGHLKGQKPTAGDVIEIIGKHQDIDALAANAGTNGYEILTNLGARYERHYIRTP